METRPVIDPIPPVRLYRINAGSCNGCDVELATTAAVARFDVERLGCSYSEAPAEADIVLITGPLTLRVKDKMLRLYGEVPEPKVTVAVGVCPISGGVFRDSYAVSGPADRYLPVDVNVPGCPPHPLALIAGIAKAANLWRERCGYAQPLSEYAGDRKDAVALTGLRGRMRFNAAACVGCRMCEHVCAGGAIRFDELDQGLRLTLWHNSCAFCGLCSHYCPTKALTVTEEWQLSHFQEDTFSLTEQGFIPFTACSGCGHIMLPATPELLRVSYRKTSPEIERLKTLCPECRQKQSLGGIRR